MGFTINEKYYADLLRQLRTFIKSKRLGKLMKGVLFHADNTEEHKFFVSINAVRDCGFELVYRPPYSLSSAPQQEKSLLSSSLLQCWGPALQ